MSTPRKVIAKTPLDDVEGEVFFARSALEADPDAKDLLAMTDTRWSPIEPLRSDKPPREPNSIQANRSG